jgi:hypothetical protein
MRRDDGFIGREGRGLEIRREFKSEIWAMKWDILEYNGDYKL